MINWETGPDIYIRLYIKQINNKDLLYSTENSTPDSVMADMEKESKKGVCVCVCVCLCVYTQIHFAVYLKLTQHCKSMISQ